MRQAVELPAILSLGSNLGDCAATLTEAIAEIGRIPGVRVRKTSTFHETPALKPTGIDEDAPAYLNAAVAIRTALLPEELLARLAAIETAHGRVRAERWGDRTLDIDIVAMGPVRVNTESLTLPHPRAFERDFVLAPWLEIEPDAVLAGHGRVDELLAALGSTA